LFALSSKLSLIRFISGGVFVPVPPDIGPQELQRRISACKPSCVVAGGGAIDEDLLDVIDQVNFLSLLRTYEKVALNYIHTGLH